MKQSKEYEEIITKVKNLSVDSETKLMMFWLAKQAYELGRNDERKDYEN